MVKSVSYTLKRDRVTVYLANGRIICLFLHGRDPQDVRQAVLELINKSKKIA